MSQGFKKFKSVEFEVLSVLFTLTQTFSQIQ